MNISNQEQVKLCTLLADQLLEADGWGAETIEDDCGNETYTSDTQERFNDYYGLIWEAIENAKS
tara:strand:+ start:114 stop:305 length:192 start_codon:yes stop_codon:yes gene_type:complete